MYEPLKRILEIQELDMKRIRLMRLKKSCLREFYQIEKIETDAARQSTLKEGEVLAVKTTIRQIEGGIEEIQTRVKDLNKKQSAVKKVEEFNALSQELSSLEKDKIHKEHKLSDLYDNITGEEELLERLRSHLLKTKSSSRSAKEEIAERVEKINEEGNEISKARTQLAKDADPETLRIYERLLRNKKDRVVVPIENRSCDGCHIILTPQHENLVRRGERILFCEHCSRVHYWQESEALEGSVVATKKRRRRKASLVQ